MIINVVNILVVLCLIVELVLIFQYAYSLLVSLNSDIFNGLTKALSIRFFGGILLHGYLFLSLVWSFFLSGDKGYNSIVLFLMSFLMIITLLASVNSYFYYSIRKQLKKNVDQTIRDIEPSSDVSIELVNKQ